MSELFITSVKGYPMARVTLNGNSFRIHHSEKKKVRPGNVPNSVFVPISYLWEFLDINKELIGCSMLDIPVNPASVNYYGFDKCGSWVYRTALTETFVSDFLNYDGDKIIRFEPNTHNGVNSLGMRIPEFETSILVNAFSGSIVGSDTTEDECKAIQKCCTPGGEIDNAINEHLYYLHNLEKLPEAKKIVYDYENQLNQIFNQYHSVLTAYNDSLETYPCDSGLTNVYTSNQRVNSALHFLNSASIRTGTSLDVNFPSDYINCSHSTLILSRLRELCDNPILKEIWVNTIYSD